MGVLVMVIGKSGSGKSSSLRHFEDGEVGVLNIAGKPLPFKKHLPIINSPNYEQIKTAIMSGQYPSYVIDDSTYLLQFEFFRYADQTGYGKFTTLAQNFKNMLDVVRAAPPNVIVYLFHHPQFGEAGEFRPQTVGKMLDSQLCIEGLFPIIIECSVVDGEHVFITTHGTNDLAKAPVDVDTGERMLPAIMDNDLKAVDDAIRAFWNLPRQTKQEVANA